MVFAKASVYYYCSSSYFEQTPKLKYEALLHDFCAMNMKATSNCAEKDENQLMFLLSDKTDFCLVDGNVYGQEYQAQHLQCQSITKLSPLKRKYL